MRNNPTIVFLTGASGGQDNFLANLSNRLSQPNYFFLHYDSIGIPPFHEMIQQAGSLECWQEMTTHGWVG